MFSLLSARNVMTNSLGRTGLVLSKYSPEILMVAGIGGVIASTILACRATLKIDEVTKKYKEKANEINEFAEKNAEKLAYTDEDKRRDLAIVYTKKAVDLARLYAPAAALGAISIGCIVGSHHILSQRNIAIVAAYKLIDEGFSAYRKRVIDDLGTAKDVEYRYGIKQETVTETTKDENGKKIKTTKTIETVSEDYQPSIYAKFFDQLSCQWSRSPEHNLFFLKTAQNWANELLKSRGHVFLNEVYDELGIPRTREGAIVGWIKYSKDGDDYIDFDIYNPRNANRAFVNGYNDALLLDFNVDGIIYDQI